MSDWQTRKQGFQQMNVNISKENKTCGSSVIADILTGYKIFSLKKLLR